jgi:four helix bundle protein
MGMTADAGYEIWEKSVPQAIASDPLWHMRVYRLALFVADVSWPDVTRLLDDRRTQALSDQLYRALGSIDANVAEGYSRSSIKDQARFFEYALGSARESRDWYYKARHVLGNELADQRIGQLTHIVRLLLTIISSQRSRSIGEEAEEYFTSPS